MLQVKLAKRRERVVFGDFWWVDLRGCRMYADFTPNLEVEAVSDRPLARMYLESLGSTQDTTKVIRVWLVQIARSTFLSI